MVQNSLATHFLMREYPERKNNVMLSNKWFVYVLAVIFCFCFGYVVSVFIRDGSYVQLGVSMLLLLISGVFLLIGLDKLEKAEETIHKN